MIKLFSKALILFVFFSALGPSISRAETPDMVAQKFQQNLLAVMKEAKQLSIRQRYERLGPSVAQAFHLPLMTRISTGAFWKTATKEQKKQLIAAFRRMSVSTLATLFKSYNGETFKSLGEKPGPRQLRLVKTEMTRPKKNSVPITYIAKKFRNQWYLIDVIVDNGISELKVRRSEYRGILKSAGIQGLIKALNKKADELTKSSK